MFENAELGRKVDKATFAAREPELREALLDAQLRLKSAGFATVVVIAGAEGAGKGETVNLLLSWLDARGVVTHALGAPTEEERLRPEFYRFWCRLPGHGQIGIFFGSWYTRPITEHSLGHLDDDALEQSLGRIVEFERMLADEGVLLVKVWLHITRKQQRQRFERLAADRDTAWRVTRRDWKFHRTYDQFIASASRALRRTSTGGAPWHIVEAWDARHRHLTVAEALLAALEQRLAAPARPAPAAEPLPAPAPVNLLSALDLRQRVAPAGYRRDLAAGQLAVGRWARKLTARERAAVLVFEGMDAAGKGGAIRRVTQALDARFYEVVSIAAPSDEEKARPYLWRFWRHVPPVGHIAIFDRSWYGRVLVERIEGFCRPEDWRRAYAEINAFEQQLVEAGVTVLKFWLAISAEEQLRRFQAREALGHKRYKITPEDCRNRERWDAYVAAACEMVERTSTEIAPWTLVAAEDKSFARLKVLATVEAGLRAALRQK